MADREAKSGSKKQTAFLIILVLCVVAGIGGFVLMAKKPVVNKIITIGDRAPDFRLQSLDGRSVSLSDLRGKIVMVHFWATWCPPCVEEIPLLAKFSADFAGTDLVMLAVSVDEGGGPAVAAFLKKSGLNLPVLLDPDRAVAGSYGTFKFPETYVVDRKGMVRYKLIGGQNWMDPEAYRGIREMLAERQ